MDKIPQDILIEILSRFTLKSLARFKIVSKEWHYVITNSVPVADNPMAIVHRSAENHSHESFHRINHMGDEEIVSFPIKNCHSLKIHSSCKGLLLVQIRYDLFVWNPLTKFIKKVLICDALETNYYHFWGIAGLCYDNLVNKYKVVVATHHLSFIDQAFLVGTCGSDKLEHCSFPSKIIKADSGPYFREHIHWYYSTGPVDSGVPQQIAYFDPQENQFINLPTPQPKDDNIPEVIIGLVVLDGCLSITRSSIHPIFQFRLELLAMKEYGVGNSWEIVLIISDQLSSFPCGVAVPVCKHRDSGEMVCIFRLDTFGTRVYNENGIVSSNFDLKVRNLVAYDECVTSPADQLYWENVEKNFPSDDIPSFVCSSSTCAISHTCTCPPQHRRIINNMPYCVFCSLSL